MTGNHDELETDLDYAQRLLLGMPEALERLEEEAKLHLLQHPETGSLEDAKAEIKAIYEGWLDVYRPDWNNSQM